MTTPNPNHPEPPSQPNPDSAPVISSPSGAEPMYARPLGARPERVLVLGGSGYIGGRLLPRLVNSGYTVRVLSRRRERLEGSAGDSLEVVAGDASDAGAVDAAMQGVDVVYYLIHSMTTERDFARVDRQIAQNVAGAAARHGVRRIIYLGGLTPETSDLSVHLASRHEVAEILEASRVPTLVFQAGVVIGSGSASFEMVRHLTEVLPVMPAPKWVLNRIQPIAIRDVMHYLLAAPRVGAEVGGTFDIGGPDVLTYAAMMNGYARAAGLPPRRILALPVLTPRLASHWVNLVTPVPGRLARPLVESLQHDCVMRDHRIDGVIAPPPAGLTPYAQAVSLALRRIEVDQVETSWVDAAVSRAPSDPLPSDPEWAGRVVYTDLRSEPTYASRDALWKVITGIGGENGWYSPPVLWALRGWMDRLVGGVGLQRGRRNRSDVRVGDAIDFWRVEVCEPGRMLRLRAEMRLPGLAWLELTCEGDETDAEYVQRAIFFPRGLAGRLYWLAVTPFHGIVFAGMARRIVEIAESDEANRVQR
ncbi:SDR family oxidoreductase [Micrococcales bacterium 31B]|nr:SDR family oxidoreductase [Micrococcales bacterium 31B]